MSTSPRSSAQASWRERRATSSTSRGRLSKRVSVSLLGIALLAVLVWALWQLFAPKLFVFALPIIAYEVPVAPPIDYASEDKDAISERSSVESPDLGKLGGSDAIDNLKTHLQGVLGGSHFWLGSPSLVLYLNSHGVAEDGAAWVLYSGNFLQDGPKKRYWLGDLLKQVADCSAKTKLVVLDAAHLQVDPRLGVVVNEFGRMLDKEVREIDDDSLWVLASASPLELSHVSARDQRSVFAYYVSEGLRGEADRDGEGNRCGDDNGTVELHELVDFVRRGVADWVRRDSGGDEGQETQVPCIYRGGKGAEDVAKVPRGIKLCAASRAAAPAEPEGETQTPPKMDAGVQKLLAAAWKQRDDAEKREKGASPVDYAPHLWREYQETLLGYEQRLRAGKAYAEKAARQLEIHQRAAGKWLKHDRDPDAPELFDRLAAARQRPGGEGPDKSLREAWELRNDLASRAVYYVRWHAATVMRRPGVPHPFHTDIVSFLKQLQDLDLQVEDILREKSAGGPVADGARDRVSETKDALRAVHERLRTGMEAEAQKVINTPSSKLGLAGRIEVLLSTPLLSAADRLSLLEKRDKLEHRLPKAGEFLDAEEPKVATLTPWEPRLKEQARLEKALACLVAPSAAQDLPSLDAPVYSERFWQDCGKLGKGLRKIYEDLPTQVREVAKSRDASQVQRRDHWLRMVDARDARHVPRDLLPPTVERTKVAVPLAVTGPTSILVLKPESPERFQLRIQGLLDDAKSVDIRLEYDQKDFDLCEEGKKEAVESGKFQSVALRQGRINYVISRPNCIGGDSAIKVQVRADGSIVPCQVAYRRPLRDVVELVAKRAGAEELRSSDENQTIDLRPFPKRTTTYHFSLVNKSGREKSLLVEWLVLPGSWGRQSKLDGVLNDLGRPGPGIVRLCEQPVKLPASGEPQPLAFTTAGEKSAASPADKAAKPAAGESPGAVPITGGLACVLRDPATKAPQSIRRVTFVPLSPAAYISPKVAYNANKGQINVEVTADRDLPPFSKEDPIVVQWDMRGKTPAEAAGSQLGATLDPESPQGRLFLDTARAANKIIEVWLTVDDYPRVFHYKVQCDQDREDVLADNDPLALQITAPPRGKFYAGPLLKQLEVEFQVDAPTDAFRDPEDMVLLQFLREDETAVCRARQFFSDRQWVMHFKPGDPQGDLRVHAAVGDFKVPVDLGTLSVATVRIRADLRLSSKVAKERPRPSDMVEVRVDAFGPKFTLDPPAPVTSGEDIRLTARIEECLSGVKKVEFGLQGEKPGDFAPAPKPKEGASVDGKVWSASLPTKDLPEGQLRILVRVTNTVGNHHDRTADVKVVPRAPPPKPADPAEQVKGTIRGRTVFREGGVAASGMTVTLSSGDKDAPVQMADPVTSDLYGNFEFPKKVPLGKYTLTARGAPRGRDAGGSASVELSADSKDSKGDIQKDVVIDVQ
jgi:hypothetical protein